MKEKWVPSGTINDKEREHHGTRAVLHEFKIFAVN